ncbi:MAG: D-xylonate dehydratase, partial [Phenylobacterium sp.]|nr:D-xylonate dehydratase [Phenylobacterium sp.]
AILHATPEAAIGGGLSLLRTGDRIRIDLPQRRCDLLVDEAELAKRTPVTDHPPSQTPWQELYRAHVGQLADGAVLEFAVKYRGVARTTPRHNH